MRIFEKAVKNRRNIGGSAPRLPHCYYRQLLQHFVECVSSAKRVFIRLEKEQM